MDTHTTDAIGSVKESNSNDHNNSKSQTDSSIGTSSMEAKSDGNLEGESTNVDRLVNTDSNIEDDPLNDDIKERMAMEVGYETGDDNNNGSGNNEASGNRNPESGNEDEFKPVDRFDKMPFHDLCRRLEAAWENKKGGRGNNSKFRQQSYKLNVLMPQKMIDSLRKCNGTPFPWVRLIVPENDTSRQFMMKQKKIEKMYSGSFGLSPDKQDMMKNYTNPSYVPADRAGDLSLVAEFILQGKLPKDKHSDMSVKEINQYLDHLASFRNARLSKGHSSHKWWQEAKAQRYGRSHWSQSQLDHKSEREKETTWQILWLDKIRERGLSPLEHKWLIRIILGDKMDVGVGVVTLLEWYSPYGKDVWNAHNNLQKVCTLLSNPAFIDQRKRLEELKKAQDEDRASLWQPQIQPAELGSKVTPMVSTRTYFDRLMTRTQDTHQLYLKRFYKPENGSKHKPLSLRFPALSVEIKLDGERMIVHMQNGRVRMNTRNGKWYSELYTPVLGPSLRDATSHYPNISLMLDGEVESWDDEKQALIPFGENRTVARLRRDFLAENDEIQDLDKDLHGGDTDPNIMRVADDRQFTKPDKKDEKGKVGEHMWLKILFFDILFVDGPDGRRLLDDCGLKDVPLGSIINLPLLNRKQILHQLITVQDNKVEICPSIVLRPNGDAEDPLPYYACSGEIMMDCGHAASLLDSTSATIKGMIPNLEDVDYERLQGKKDSDISMMRSREVDKFYKTVVEDHKFEGLVVKDLASPYLFGNRKFWWKFKPDYEKEGAQDLDVAILGCSFACGRRLGGSPSSFLVGVLDSKDTEAPSEASFMTLCTINAASVNFELRDAIWRRTGFERGNTSKKPELGSWYAPETKWELPACISPRSLQNGGVEDNNGWRFDKSKGYPDLWIEPKNSLVLTIKGAELVRSDEHSCGVTVRFPRIMKVRISEAGSDEKSVWEVETDADIWKTYSIMSRDRRVSPNTSSQSYSQFFGAHSPDEAPHKFLTPEELSRLNRKKKTAVVVQQARAVPTVEEPETTALEGLTFVVLEGCYDLIPGSFEAKEGQKNGWYDLASCVRSEADVIHFIKTHGGKYRSVPTYHEHEFLIGGEKDDARVKIMIDGLRTIRQGGCSLRETKTKENCKHIDGILKWTYIFHLVYRWKSFMKDKRDARLAEDKNDEDDDDVDEESILSMQDSDLVPGPEHYLMKASTNMSVEQEIFNLDRTLNLHELERVIDTPLDAQMHVPWQYRAVNELDEKDRWIMSTAQTKLWPYVRTDEREMVMSEDLPKKPVVLYPDIFKDGFGLDLEKESVLEVLEGNISPRWADVETGINVCDSILSVLPLARAMGALDTPNLHRGVTHVLVALKIPETWTEITFPIDAETEKAASLLFIDTIRGDRLIERLKAVIPDKSTIKIVTPQWIVKKWDA